MWRFHRWAFSTGLVALDETRNVPNPAGRLRLGESFETANGKFLPTGANECLFRSRAHMFSFRINTPFPLKGSIEWSHDEARVRGRVPLFSTIFLVAWVVGWTAASLAGLLSGNTSANGAALSLLLGLAAGGGIVAVSLPLEKRRAKALVAELEAALNGIAER